MEKQHRLAEDVFATKTCCLAILEVLFEAGNWKQLNEHIILLAKRRSQLKQVPPAALYVIRSLLTALTVVVVEGSEQTGGLYLNNVSGKRSVTSRP